jgi:hypothetical protein
MHGTRDALALYRDGAPPDPRPYADLHEQVLALAHAGDVAMNAPVRHEQR